MKNFTKLLLSATLMVLTNLTGTYAQVDQTFWFVVPETTRDHAKTPGILRITAFDQEAKVSISQPANLDFQPIKLTVPKGTQQKVEFHDYGRGIEGPTSGGGWNSNTDIPLPYTGERLDIEKMLITIENGTIDPVEWSNTPYGTRYVVVNQDWPNGIDGNKNPIGIEGPEDIPILNKGLLIESTNGADISVYYEIANKNNPERFNLKGKNALGRKFLVPSQNTYYNNQSGSHGAREKIDIVATEDGTEVTIRFNRNNHDFYGKPEEGDTLTVKLKKGQTFPLRSNKTDKGDHLGGIIIESNKDIAVTISDDSIRYDTKREHWDLIGDQLIPISVAGTNYIAMHPSYGTIHEKKYWADYETASNVNESTVMNSVFIWPTENDTKISINGTSVGTYDLGEFKAVPITNNAIYISANKDVLVYQVSSYKYELGGAVLPALDCTGSNSVSFAKIYEGAFFVQILTKKKNIWDENGHLKLEALVQDGGTLRQFPEFFDIDPDNSSADWQPVTGTKMDNENEEQWYSFVKLFKHKDVKTGDLTSNVPYTIRFKQSGDKDPSIFDDQLFHLSVLDANGASMSYGYFSSYNSVAVAAPKAVCVGEDIILSSNGYAVDWYHESDRNTPIDTLKTEITVQDQGEYWVIIPGSNCSSSEPVEVKYVIPDFELEKEDKYCPGDPIELGIDASTLPDNASYQWTVEARHSGTGTTTKTTHLNEGENPWELPAMQAEANTQYIIRLLVEAELFGVACAYSNEVELTVGPEPYISLSANEKVCAGTELVAEYRDYQNYVWTLSGNQEPISKTHILKPEVSGNYTLTVTTVDGCSDSREIAVTVHELPTVILEDQIDCVPQPGQFEVNGFGSETSFRWRNGNTGDWSPKSTGTSSSFTAEKPMNLSVEVTDNNGCVATASASFDWHAEKIFEQKDVPICYTGEYSIDIDEDDEYGPLTWTYSSDGGATWRDLDGTNQFVTDNSILTIKPIDASNTFSGQYRVEGTYDIDGKNCPVEGQFNLLVEDPPTVSLEPQGKDDAKMCEGGTLTITIGENNLDDSNMTYQWSMLDPFDGTLIELKDKKDPWIVAEDAGDYQVKVVYGDNMCHAFGDITVETIKAPQMTAEGAMVCPGEGATLRVIDYVADNGDTQPASYEWIKADPGLPLAPNPQILFDKEISLDEVNIENAGWYRITTYDDQGCFASQYLEVGMHNVPVVTLEDQTMCEGDDFTLPHPEDPNGEIDSYAWEIEDSEGGYRTISEAELSLLDDGTHTLRLTYTTDDGCIESAEMTLTVLPAPEFSLPAGDVCEEDDITIIAEDSFSNYSWSMPGNALEGPNEISFTPNANGKVTLTVTDKNDCTATRSTTVAIHKHPLVSLTDQSACPGELSTFQVDFEPESYSIIWDLPNGRMLYNTNTVTPQNGTYSVSVTDAFGCSGSATATATTFDVPDVNLGEMAYVTCPDRDGFARMEIEATGSDMETWNFDSIYWEDDGEPAPAYNGQTSRNVSFDTRLGSVNPSSFAIYVQNNNGCWSFANKLLLTIPPSTFEAGRIVEACEPTDGTVFEEVLDAGEYTFYDDSNDELLELPIQGYTWYRQEGEDSEPVELVSGEDVREYKATQGGRYLIEIYDGCWYLTDTFNIDLFPSPVIAGIDSTIYQQIVVMAESGTEPYSYTLNDGQAQDDPTFTGLGNGDYTVFVVDARGCEASTTFRFESSYDIKVPNFFTPNGDGYNDTWLIEGLEKLPESIIYIYDRYGKLLRKYTSNDPAWNGEYLSRPVPSDDYWYVIHLLPVDKLLKGHFTLKR